MRSYNTESVLGAFIADVMRALTQTEAAFTNAGGLRADIPRGDVTIGNVQDALPFYSTVDVFELTGAQIKEVLEQGFTLLRGMVQVSGIVAHNDLTQPYGERLVDASIGEAPIEDARIYRIATNNFLGEGGDLYQTFPEGKKVDHIDKDLAELVIEHFKTTGTVDAPPLGRLISR